MTREVRGAMVTEVPRPARRVFLAQSVGERLAGFVWRFVRVTLFRWSPPPLHGWRRTLLRLFGARIGRGARIAPSVRVDFPWNLRVGEGTAIADHAVINCMGTVEVGPRTLVGRYAHLCAGTHAYVMRDMRIERRPITVGAECWIATDAFVGPGVTIGDGSLLAARSSAFSNLPARMVCIGEPARPVKPWGGTESAGPAGRAGPRPTYGSSPANQESR